MLKLIETCDQCKKTLQVKDVLMVGETNGKHRQSWYKLCPHCYEEMYRKYVLPTLKVDKRTEKVLQRKEIDVKLGLEKHASHWKQF